MITHMLEVPTIETKRVVLRKVELADVADIYESGILASHLRKDIPYVPHITVGSSRSKEACGQMASKLESSTVRIDGIVDAVTVLTFQDDIVKAAAKISLSG